MVASNSKMPKEVKLDTPYKQTIRDLSDRIVRAQSNIRILDAIKWDHSIQEKFFADKCKELPTVTKEYYSQNALPFQSQEKRQEFDDIIKDIRKHLGHYSPLAKIMERICSEYIDVTYMLESRGQSDFARISQKLYGSSTDVFHAGDPNLKDMAEMIMETLENIGWDIIGSAEEKNITGEEAAAILQKNLDVHFKESAFPIKVKTSDIVSDASAGADYIKIRKEARFNERDLRLLEIHEGWVHLGTTINGMYQPICTFLSKGAPSSTLTQEGLAIMSEILNFVSHPGRVRRLTNRVRAISMAQEGANFLEVFNFFKEQGFSEMESYNNTTRVFRGSTPTGKPFTKDLAYSKGFVLVYNYIRIAIRQGKMNLVPWLFCGKATLEDLRTLEALSEEGLVVPPKFVPSQFLDFGGLASWMCYSNFLNRMDVKKIEKDYINII